uniref:CSON013712 protein n=1 Tax=Culicoides sonorensis TaxID=179676 RepID=A0A336KPN0_CULSO
MSDNEEIIEATTEKPKEIHKITKDDACKISSGQVISSLAIAVKELVENSLDAGATLIEVKFKDRGLLGLEVVDNGCGVKEEDFHGLTSRHATSKLRDFKDLEEVETFGFRGEALNSLCALGNLTIITKHSSAPSATKLEFDHGGNIINQTTTSGQVGTQVHLKDLFIVLPVRKREFAKNIKKEYAKALEILTAYCLISSSVRIIVSNIEKNGFRHQVMATNLNTSLMETVRSVFGQKQVEQLIEIKTPVLEGEENLRLEKYKIEGYVSNCHHGSGRSSKDRQFFYINSRPCESKTLLKFINEIYRKYNQNQYPFIFLNIKMNKDEVDINVTPDKRQLFIADEQVLKQAVMKSLSETYEAMQQMFPIRSVKASQSQNTSQGSEKSKSSQEKRKSDDSDSEIDEIALPEPEKFSQMLSQWKSTGNTDEAASSPETRYKRKLDDEIDARTKRIKMIQQTLKENAERYGKVTITEKTKTHSYESDPDENEAPLLDSNSILTPDSLVSDSSYKLEIFSPKLSSTNKENAPEKVKQITCKTVSSPATVRKLRTIPKESYEDPPSLLTPTCSNEMKSLSISVPKALHDSSETISTSLDEIKAQMNLELDARDAYKQNKEESCDKFKSKINPQMNESAEMELSREITKDMFLKMEIIGQFNLGFIIVKLNDDLFIVDQHASSEKYNFEDLIKNTEIQSQHLVCAEQLELSATNEIILMDNLPIFNKNGFKFKINEEKPATKRISLIAKPFSKNWNFGKEDIEELLHMLYENPNSKDVRPSRVRCMFASRACRKSVMIGDHLTQGQMNRIVGQLSQLDQPWNCPHGRPTMRHLANLNSVKLSVDSQEMNVEN